MRAFPFHDVIDQDDAKLALLLVAVDPRIGGVLLRGHKGSAKTTLARGLADLLDGAPFVELPLGATEDRLIGTLDTAAALTGDGFHFQPGLLADAHGGVLYVDEINLLADHLVDTLLDVTVSGENVVERDGISHRHPARFVLVGSMNPEEGELRPQLLDRFGFCVEMTAPADIADRVEALRRRLAFDHHPLADPGPASTGRREEPQVAAERIGTARPAATPTALLEAAARLAIEVGAEGLRADLTLCRAASALAGLEGRGHATLADLRRVAPLALAHRSRRGPFDPPTLAPEALEQALDQALGDPRSRDPGPGSSEDPEAPADPDEPDDDDELATPERGSSGAPERPLVLGSTRRTPLPQPERAVAPRGRFVRDAPVGDNGAVAAAPTVRALARRRATDPTAVLRREDLRVEVRVGPKRRTIVLCVDLSGSMGADERARAATGTALGLLTGAYQRRDRVALVGFRGPGAEVLLAPTSSIEVARNRLDHLVTGGETPLADGIARGLEIAATATADGGDALLVVLTDGRATGRPDSLEAALAAAGAVQRQGVASLVLDCETGPIRLRLAEQVAAAMGARHFDVDSLDPAALAATIQGSAASASS
ncbi:MAG: ATP-binding protein [Acidimicrobiales bacterium]|nr:ATP-binding protein [Acidimicrobiales bacterium]